MTKSDSIKEIAKALCIVQANLKGAKADAENPFFKSKYADLHSVVEAARELLGENGLSVVQTAELIGNVPCLNTCLMHTSGEWISGSLPLYPKSLDPQSIGSAISYGRRYSLAAMLGIVQVDDDGEKAMERGRQTMIFPPNAYSDLPPVATYESDIPGDPGAFICPYGKDKGKRIDSLTNLQIMENLKYWQNTLSKKGEKPHRQLAQFLDAMQAYLNQADGTQEDIAF